MSYNNGEKVPIIYRQSNPIKSLVNSLFIVWTIPALLLIVGISAINRRGLFSSSHSANCDQQKYGTDCRGIDFKTKAYCSNYKQD